MKEASQSINFLFKPFKIALVSLATKKVLINTLHKKTEIRNHEK